jgi:hypothetical protein
MSWLDIDLVQVQDRGFSFEVFKSRTSNQTIAHPLQRWDLTLHRISVSACGNSGMIA